MRGLAIIELNPRHFYWLRRISHIQCNNSLQSGDGLNPKSVNDHRDTSSPPKVEHKICLERLGVQSGDLVESAVARREHYLTTLQKAWFIRIPIRGRARTGGGRQRNRLQEAQIG